MCVPWRFGGHCHGRVGRIDDVDSDSDDDSDIDDDVVTERYFS